MFAVVLRNCKHFQFWFTFQIVYSEEGSKKSEIIEEINFTSGIEAHAHQTESINKNSNNEVDEVVLVSEDASESEKESVVPETPPSISANEQPSTMDISVFIGSEQLTEDDTVLQENRRKLLEDVGEKLRDRPKTRHLISDKLNNRLASQLPSSLEHDSLTSSSTSVPLMSVSLSPGEDKSAQYITGLKTPPTKSSLKSSNGSERRLTRSTSRTTVTASDSECDITSLDSEVPDEVRAPLPASMLHYTLQRMQETIAEPLLNPTSSLSLAPEISCSSECSLEKESVKVGLVEAKYVSETKTFQFCCLSKGCAYISDQSTMFLLHIKVHQLKPVSAPCRYACYFLMSCYSFIFLQFSNFLIIIFYLAVVRKVETSCAPYSPLLIIF